MSARERFDILNGIEALYISRVRIMSEGEIVYLAIVIGAMISFIVIVGYVDRKCNKT